MTQTSQLWLPMVVDSVSAGEPQPLVSATKRVDLAQLLTGRSRTCVLLKVRGDSMQDINLSDGDLVIVDTQRTPKPNDIVVAELNGSMLIKRHKLNNGHKQGLFLVPASDRFEPIEIHPNDHYTIFGVVTTIIHSLTE